MTKVAIFTDSHSGVRGDAVAFADHQDWFYKEFFFPELEKRGIKTIFHGGDFFDRRQFITLKTMDRLKNTFIKCLTEGEYELHLLVGNHDVLYRNTNTVNSPSILFHGYSSVHIYDEPTVVHDVLLVPWINKENYDTSLEALKNTKAKHVLGHFELKGFEMHRGQVCESGMTTEIFDRFQTVMSGHFHTRSSSGNITYLGSPFEMTWSDFNDPRGFHIFDTETGELEFVKNPESMFFRCEYDTVENVKSWTPYKPVSLNSKYVKVIVKNKGNAYQFDEWLREITSYSPADIQIVESTIDVIGVEFTLEEMENRSKSNIDIMNEYIQALGISDEEKAGVFNYLKTIYAECIQL